MSRHNVWAVGQLQLVNGISQQAASWPPADASCIGGSSGNILARRRGDGQLLRVLVAICHQMSELHSVPAACSRNCEWNC